MNNKINVTIIIKIFVMIFQIVNPLFQYNHIENIENIEEVKTKKAVI